MFGRKKEETPTVVDGSVAICYSCKTLGDVKPVQMDGFLTYMHDACYSYYTKTGKLYTDK
jgi:hypothetical protein